MKRIIKASIQNNRMILDNIIAISEEYPELLGSEAVDELNNIWDSLTPEEIKTLRHLCTNVGDAETEWLDKYCPDPDYEYIINDPIHELADYINNLNNF